MKDEEPDDQDWALASLALIIIIALYMMAAYGVESMHLAYL